MNLICFFCRDYYRKYDWGSIDVPVTDKPAQFRK